MIHIRQLLFVCNIWAICGYAQSTFNLPSIMFTTKYSTLKSLFTVTVHKLKLKIGNLNNFYLILADLTTYHRAREMKDDAVTGETSCTAANEHI